MRYTVEYNYNMHTQGYDYEIREYRNPKHIIKKGYLPEINIHENGFNNVKEYILCYGIKE